VSMSSVDPAPSVHPSDLSDDVIATVRRWLTESSGIAPDKSAERLAGVLRDPVGLDFTLGFVDRVVRPEDLRVAGRNLEVLSRSIPKFLPAYLRAAIYVGGNLAPILPWPIVPISRWVLRNMVSHLVIDATPKQLDKTLAKLRRQHIRLNMNLLGEAVLGNDESDRRLAGTRDLLARDDVDYVSIKASSVSAQLSMWAFDETVDRVVERLTPLYELAAVSSKPKFINLDMEEYHDLDFTVAVFKRVLDQPQLLKLEAGIVLQAYLPDALGALQDLTAWARQRQLNGGAGIKVRVVKGANLAMEQVDATMHGWPLATYGIKVDTDTNYKRVLDWAFTPERTDAVRIGVAGHNLFDVAYAWLLAKQRHVDTRVEFEMLLGMATAQAEVVKRDVGGLLLYTPVVHPHEFDSAISYLVRRLEENASTDNFMSGVFELSSRPEIFARESNRFMASLSGLDDAVPTPNRVQSRLHPTVRPLAEAFQNEPDTDSSLADNREWGRRILERSVDSDLGIATIEAAAVTDSDVLETMILDAHEAGIGWGAVPATDRARILHDAGDVLAAFRGRLIEVMATETGKTIAEGDVEVSEATDFAHYYAERALELDRVVGAKFVPTNLTVVTPPWNFPVAIPAGSVLSALAAGSAVIIKPAPQARRSAAVMIEALWEAGVPRSVLTLVDIEEGDLGRQLVAHPSVGRVILTGAWETASLFRSWRADLPLLAETSGKNAIIVTPSADLDLAVADVVRSAFGHAGQKCSAASLVILVGSVGTSERFRRQLVDSVKTLRVGLPSDPNTVMGPIVEPAHGKLLKALTTLGEGEEWLVKPRQQDVEGQLWTPGVRTGVAPGSEFHLTEYFGPVLGVMTARTLEEAIDLQNASDYGLTAGIHSLEPDEVSQWIESVDAGNLYVNRGITGAIVRRQPFGGWKRSTVGASAKAGGPNYLMTLGGWEPLEIDPGEDLALDGISAPVARVIERAQAGMEFLEFDRVRLAALRDQRSWSTEFGISRDVSGLGVERDVFRYRAVPVTLRLSEGASMGDLVRLIAAGTLARSVLYISTAIPLPPGLVELFGAGDASSLVQSVIVETDARWHARLVGGELATKRIRLISPVSSGGAGAGASVRGGASASGSASASASASGSASLGASAGPVATLAGIVKGNPDIAIYGGPVTTAGRVELLAFLHEQAVSITAHRFGNPDRQMAELTV
jgi:RHH-type proline utilization regulon transcriptional repressor/proline dehydrogenase/delta 1-pyrroline-5-carboxylate dehydrogenase